MKKKPIVLAYVRLRPRRRGGYAQADPALQVQLRRGRQIHCELCNRAWVYRSGEAEMPDASCLHVAALYSGVPADGMAFSRAAHTMFSWRWAARALTA